MQTGSCKEEKLLILLALNVESFKKISTMWFILSMMREVWFSVTDTGTEKGILIFWKSLKVKTL